MAEARAATHNAAPNNHAGLTWAMASLLRGDYKQSEYGRVILPLVLLRRLDCVLEATKAQVLARVKTLTVQTVGPVLKTVTGIEADSTSRLNLRAILADPSQVAGNLRAWIAAFDAQIGRLDRAKFLYLVLSKVTEVDLHPDKVTNVEMGYLWLARRTDGLAFGRMIGRLPVNGMPAREPPVIGKRSDSQPRGNRDRLVRRPKPASAPGAGERATTNHRPLQGREPNGR